MAVGNGYTSVKTSCGGRDCCVAFDGSVQQFSHVATLLPAVGFAASLSVAEGCKCANVSVYF
jgi:hypothetical protein